MKRCICGRLIYDWWVDDEDLDDYDEPGPGTHALCDECVSRLTPLQADAAGSKHGDGPEQTAAPLKHDG